MNDDGTRTISATEIGGLTMVRAQIGTFKTLPAAACAAVEKCPELPWRRIFEALEAAGVVAFGVGGVDGNQ
jgi:hypothetical protein